MPGIRTSEGLDLRKSPIQSRASHTVVAILQAAANLLESRGVDGYTTNAIARSAGVSIGSLYQYFPSKDAVTAALINRETSTVLSSVLVARDIEDWRAALKSMIYVAAAQHMSRPRLTRVLEVEARRLAIPRRSVRMWLEIHNAVVSVLRRRGREARHDAVADAWTVLTLVRALCDVAGERKATRLHELELQMSRAVFGYLEFS